MGGKVTILFVQIKLTFMYVLNWYLWVRMQETVLFSVTIVILPQFLFVYLIKLGKKTLNDMITVHGVSFFVGFFYGIIAHEKWHEIWLCLTFVHCNIVTH